MGGIYIICYLFVGISPIFGATDYMREIMGNIVGTTLSYFLIGLYQLLFFYKNSTRKTTTTTHPMTINEQNM